MRLLISLSALLISTLFVKMGIGSLRPFDAISGQAFGFSPVEIGLLASGHFAGFLLGCVFSPHLVRPGWPLPRLCGDGRCCGHLDHRASCHTRRLLLDRDPGPVRLFRSKAGCRRRSATRTAAGSSASILWSTCRGGSWQTPSSPPSPRQAMSLDNLIAIIMCFAIMPLALTQSKEPELPETTRYEPLFACRVSPLAAFGVICGRAVDCDLRVCRADLCHRRRA